MSLILIVNPELGWDSVVSVFDTEGATAEQIKAVNRVVDKNSYILIDWKSMSTVQSFLDEND